MDPPRQQSTLVSQRPVLSLSRRVRRREFFPTSQVPFIFSLRPGERAPSLGAAAFGQRKLSVNENARFR